MDLENLSEQFIQFESKTNVLQQTIRGIYFWQLIRFDLYQALAQERNLFAQAHPQTHTKNKALHLLKKLKYGINHHPFWMKKNPVDIIFLPHTRRVNGIDIYSAEIYDHIKHKPHIILYQNYLNGINDDRTTTFDLAGLRYILMNYLTRKTGFCLLNLTAQDKHILDTVEDQFRIFFKSSIPLAPLIKKQCLYFSIFYKDALRLLKKTRPQHLVMVTGYGHMPLIAAAKSLNIPTYEIQHGTISTNHMGYYYPHVEPPAYCPDIFLAHGDFWTRKPPLPTGIKTQIIGAAHVSHLQGHHEKIKKQILFFSQGTVAKDLFPFAEKVAALVPDYRIIYRLHPSEITSDYTPPAIDNFEIRHGGDEFFNDLTQSEFIATVYSTTIYEAMACGAKGIVVGLNGHNAVQDIIDDGDVTLAKTPEDFVTALKTAKPCPHPEKFYAAFNPQKIKELLG